MDLKINPIQEVNAVLEAVPSKAETLRALFCASLADGVSRIQKPLIAEDQFLCLKALEALGVRSTVKASALRVQGLGGRFQVPKDKLFLGNSGFGLRCLTALSCLVSEGRVTLDGSKEMRRRPVAELLAALNAQGVKAASLKANGCPPVQVAAGRPAGGILSVDCSRSSQFLSGLLLLAPFAGQDTELVPSAKFSSRPFADLTIDFLQKFGVACTATGKNLVVPAGQRFKKTTLRVGGDFSGMSALLAAPILTGGKIVVKGLCKDSLQPDRFILDALRRMGAQVHMTTESVRVEANGTPHPLEADFNACPDLVPTVAVLAAFASGKSRLTGIAHLQFKESNRLNAVARELKRMGITARKGSDSLEIIGGRPRGATIQTYNDHRIAMAFALAGLKVRGIKILGAHCVEKSFPHFFEELARVGR